MKRSILIIALLLAATLILTLAAGKNYPSGVSSLAAETNENFSKLEKELYEEINGLREHPEKYAKYLEERKAHFRGKTYEGPGELPLQTQEGWSAVAEAVDYMRKAKTAPEVKLSPGMSLAALELVKDQGPKGTTGHKGSDGSLPEQRLNRFGAWSGSVGEDILYRGGSAREHILVWLIDDGVANRGHRMRLLNPDYKVIGVACGPHKQFGAMCVITFAGAYTEKAPAKSADKSTNTNSAPAKTTVKKTRTRKTN